MRFHCLQHVASEPPGVIESWINQHGHQLSFTRFYENEGLPATDHFDALVIMGGSMSVHDEVELPWLVKEKELIRSAIRDGKKILGICLGSQLIADVLNAKVYPNPEKEIGFLPVYFTKEGLSHPLLATAVKELMVFHWHGETFDLPAGALHLACSSICKNQAFAIGDQILALQFHIEVSPAIVKDMIDRDGKELVEGPFIQSAEAILARTHFLETTKEVAFRLLDQFFGGEDLTVPDSLLQSKMIQP